MNKEAVHTMFSTRSAKRALLHVSRSHKTEATTRGTKAREINLSRLFGKVTGSLRILRGVLVEGGLAARRAEVVRLASVHRTARGPLRVHHHPADRILFHRLHLLSFDRPRNLTAGAGTAARSSSSSRRKRS